MSSSSFIPHPSSLPPDVVLSVRGVSKKFCRSLKRSMWYGIQDLARNMVGSRGSSSSLTHPQVPSTKHQDPISNAPEQRLRRDEFWALQDINFELRRGECVGLIGDNGAGKTTLLRLITGIYPPDAGEIALRGRLSALIALGAGFHPHLTGLENVYLNGTILGMTRAEITHKLDEIIEYAEIGEFLNAPVSTYSSGMRVRLGFAIAVNVNPDVLLVDEVLAVGDYNFQEKCMRKIDEIRASDRAIILVTHSLYRIESFCDRAIWLKNGQEVSQGPALDVVRQYLDAQEKRTQAEQQRQLSVGKTGPIECPIMIAKVEILNALGQVSDEFPFGSAICVRIHYVANRRIAQPLFNLKFSSQGYRVLDASMLIEGSGPSFVEGPGVVECQFGELPLTPKLYDIVLFVRSSNGAVDLCPMQTWATFRITDENLDRIPMHGPYALNHLRQGSPVYVPRRWRFFANDELTTTVDSLLYLNPQPPSSRQSDAAPTIPANTKP